MASYQVSSGPIVSPEKVVVYGPEGIGKSTFASQFPDPLFIDTEGGTKKLSVRRLPQPTSWAMLMDEVNEVRLKHISCGTLVIDTADWAERLCIQAVCDRANVKGIEDFDYGKGYTYVKESFGKLLNLLEETLESGHNIVITAHAQITKFELPNEMGKYDRWSMKTSKQVAPLLSEWCDMLLFANYKTMVIHDDKTKSNKAQGGKRVMYTTHYACWDAKNRDNLSDELPFDFSSIAAVIPLPTSAPATPSSPLTEKQQSATQQQTAEELPEASKKPPHVKDTGDLEKVLEAADVPENLRKLMVANNIHPKDLQAVVGQKGYFPEDMPIKDYPNDFVDGCLVAAWDDVHKAILNNLDLPF
jgi:hypothetical protein